MADAYIPAHGSGCNRPHRARRRTLAAAALATVLFILAAGPAYASDDHIGAERCGACHRPQYESWRKTPHARALARLSEKQQGNTVCRSCHTMDPWSDDPTLAGVQCESCHGAGRAYSPDLVMRDALLSELMGLEKITEATCRPCHRADAPRLRAFDYATLIQQVMHPKPPTPESAPQNP